MLLELDQSTVERLVRDSFFLDEAVRTAKSAFLRDRYPASIREKLGDALFVKVEEIYPENAAKITGLVSSFFGELRRLKLGD